jgi:hypothetical protein
VHERDRKRFEMLKARAKPEHADRKQSQRARNALSVCLNKCRYELYNDCEDCVTKCLARCVADILGLKLQE